VDLSSTQTVGGAKDFTAALSVQFNGQNQLTAIDGSTPSSSSGAGIIGGLNLSPSASGQRLGFYLFKSPQGNLAGISGWSTESHGGSHGGTQLRFETTPIASTSRASQAWVDDTGFYPQTNGTKALGGSSNYWLSGNITTLNLNSTASISGGTAGVLTIAGNAAFTGPASTDGNLSITAGGATNAAFFTMYTNNASFHGLSTWDSSNLLYRLGNSGSTNSGFYIKTNSGGTGGGTTATAALFDYSQNTTLYGNLLFSANATYNIASSSNYANYGYIGRVYLNSTAYLDGGTAGTIAVGGYLNNPTINDHASWVSGATAKIFLGDTGTYFQNIWGGSTGFVSNNAFDFNSSGGGDVTFTNSSTVKLRIGSNAVNIYEILKTSASTTSAASLNIPSGTAPTSPNDGDIWYDGTNLKIRVGSTTKTFTLT
jgi:hypothetical protein